MSIANEITRLQGGKANLKTSLNAKNDAQHQITDETIDEYYLFADSISTGSGDTILDVGGQGVEVSGTTLIFNPYIKLEYIESTGTQYINTGITGEAYWEIKGQGTYATQSSGSQVILGRVALAGYWFGITSQTVYGFGASNQSDISYSTFAIAKITTTNTNISGTINNATIPTRTITDNSYINNPYLLLNGNLGSTTYCAYYKLYSARCYQNNTLVRDFVPAKDENNVVCLYDKVSETYFYNQGTGDFIAGPEV